MDATFTFEVLFTPFEAPALRALVDAYLRGASDAEHLPSWVVGSHDSTRAATRWPDGADAAMLLLALALPGGFCLYAGDELGLPEVDLPVEARQDPTLRRSGGQDLGRDGARVPLPWTGSGPTLGFSPDGAGAPPWLPQPGGWGSRSVQVQRADGASRLNLVRAAISLRRRLWRGAGALTWVPDAVGPGRRPAPAPRRRPLRRHHRRARVALCRRGARSC